jgi:hypothetical protein
VFSPVAHYFLRGLYSGVTYIMALSKKIASIVKRFGLTYKGYVLGSLAFPPAGMYIGWNMPGASLLLRTVLVLLPAIGPLLITFGAIIKFSWLRDLIG